MFVFTYPTPAAFEEAKLILTLGLLNLSVSEPGKHFVLIVTYIVIYLFVTNIYYIIYLFVIDLSTTTQAP